LNTNNTKINLSGVSTLWAFFWGYWLHQWGYIYYTGNAGTTHFQRTAQFPLTITNAFCIAGSIDTSAHGDSSSVNLQAAVSQTTVYANIYRKDYGTACYIFYILAGC
jgi:hypothetical protein